MRQLPRRLLACFATLSLLLSTLGMGTASCATGRATGDAGMAAMSMPAAGGSTSADDGCHGQPGRPAGERHGVPHEGSGACTLATACSTPMIAAAPSLRLSLQPIAIAILDPGHRAPTTAAPAPETPPPRA